MATVELSFSIRKELKRKKVKVDAGFALISLLHVQIQESAGKWTTQNLNSIITK